MPQQSLFGKWAITDLEITVHLQPNGKVGGRIDVEVLDEHGQRCEAQSVVWTQERDVNDLGWVLKAIAEAWLWGEHGAVSSVVQHAPRAWLPKVQLQ